MDSLETKQLLAALQSGSKSAFERVYRRMAGKLFHYVNNRISEKAVSEEIVQEIFVLLWAKKPQFETLSALESYLYKAAKFLVLNFMRSEKVRDRYLEHFSLFVVQKYDNSVEEIMNMVDLKAVIDQYITQLSPKCKEAFRLNRYKHKSIKETAELMNISTRTVENYITQALRHLRKNLSHYQWLLLMSSIFTSI